MHRRTRLSYIGIVIFKQSQSETNYKASFSSDDDHKMIVKVKRWKTISFPSSYPQMIRPFAWPLNFCLSSLKYNRLTKRERWTRIEYFLSPTQLLKWPLWTHKFSQTEKVPYSDVWQRIFDTKYKLPNVLKMFQDIKISNSTFIYLPIQFWCVLSINNVLLHY